MASRWPSMCTDRGGGASTKVLYISRIIWLIQIEIEQCKVKNYVLQTCTYTIKLSISRANEQIKNTIFTSIHKFLIATNVKRRLHVQNFRSTDPIKGANRSKHSKNCFANRYTAHQSDLLDKHSWTRDPPLIILALSLPSSDQSQNRSIITDNTGAYLTQQQGYWCVCDDG